MQLEEPVLSVGFSGRTVNAETKQESGLEETFVDQGERDEVNNT